MTSPSETDKGKPGRYNIRSLERALRLLEALSDGNTWKLSELSDRLGLNSSTAYRLLATLLENDYVERDKLSGGYRIGLACLELARAYNRGDIRQNARPAMESLRDRTKESVHLGILNGWEVVYLEKLDGLHAIGLMSSRVGGRAPSYCTGLGKMLLAHQDAEKARQHFEETGLHGYTDVTITDLDQLMNHMVQVREQNYALDLAEHEREVHCIAAPVHDVDGSVVAAISISGPAARIDVEDSGQDLIYMVQQAAAEISHRLGYISRQSRNK
jgi:DNA-binding IclR family transcriptional regulator